MLRLLMGNWLRRLVVSQFCIWGISRSAILLLLNINSWCISYSTPYWYPCFIPPETPLAFYWMKNKCIFIFEYWGTMSACWSGALAGTRPSPNRPLLPTAEDFLVIFHLIMLFFNPLNWDFLCRKSTFHDKNSLPKLCPNKLGNML
jgi:hypothetical protein